MRHFESTANEFGVLNRLSEFSDGDVQTRMMLDIDKLFGQEAPGALRDLYATWIAKPRVQGVPASAAFGSVAEIHEAYGRNMTVIGVENDNPLYFHIQNHPRITPFLNHDGKRLCDLPDQMNAHAVASEYLFCKETRQPMYHEIDQTFGGRTRHFTRLLVPLADWDGAVRRLLYAVRPIEITTLRPVPSPVRANDNSPV